MIDTGRRMALDAIAAEIRVCTNCRLHETRTRAVPGEGDPDTEVVLVGEGPGFNEDRDGRPFIGRAGDLLVKLGGAGACHSDIHLMEWPEGTMDFQLPAIFSRSSISDGSKRDSRASLSDMGSGSAGFSVVFLLSFPDAADAAPADCGTGITGMAPAASFSSRSMARR